MRRDSLEIAPGLLEDNPLAKLDPEPDVLANITRRARAARRGEDVSEEAPPVLIQETAPEPVAQVTYAANTEPAPAPPQNRPVKPRPRSQPQVTVLDIDLDDPDFQPGEHQTTLRFDRDVVDKLKRMALDNSRPRKQCTMGILILNALKKTYPDVFNKS
jgi:hypothetical protein